jgi:hypothetical protein
MQRFGDDFERLDEPWARAVEVLAAVGQVDLACMHGLQAAPFRACRWEEG